MRLDTSTPTLRTSHRHSSKIFIPNSMDRAVQFAGSAMSTRTSCTKPSCRAPAVAATYKSGTWKAGRRRTQTQDRWDDCSCTITWSFLCTGKTTFMVGGLCWCHCSSAGGQRPPLGHQQSHPARGPPCEGKRQHTTQLCRSDCFARG